MNMATLKYAQSLAAQLGYGDEDVSQCLEALMSDLS